MKKILVVLFIIATSGLAGFAVGVYMTPILIAPDSPSESELADRAETATYTAQFDRNRKDSDGLHWGEGTVSISNESISLQGKLAPGPDYKLYLSPQFIETESEFLATKEQMVQVADIKTFENFLVDVPNDIDLANYNTVIVWCETFEQFITSGQYQ